MKLKMIFSILLLAFSANASDVKCQSEATQNLTQLAKSLPVKNKNLRYEGVAGGQLFFARAECLDKSVCETVNLSVEMNNVTCEMKSGSYEYRYTANLTQEMKTRIDSMANQLKMESSGDFPPMDYLSKGMSLKEVRQALLANTFKGTHAAFYCHYFKTQSKEGIASDKSECVEKYETFKEYEDRGSLLDWYCDMSFNFKNKIPINFKMDCDRADHDL